MAEADSTRAPLPPGVSICFGVPSFGEGRSILPTLDSIATAARACGLGPLTILLSDSSPTTETVDAADEWRRSHDVELLVDRSERRRIGKEARNVLFDMADADVFVGMDADVVVPAEDLALLLRDLLDDPTCEVVIGVAAPDPAYCDFRRRAGCWQLNYTSRAARLLGPSQLRAQTALWACRRSFAQRFRWSLESGLTDDVELVDHLMAHDVGARSSNARALKVPPSGFRDFFLQTVRGREASTARGRRHEELAAAAIEAVRDPVGLACYVAARVYCLFASRAPFDLEAWPVSESTKARVAGRT